jgi:predicted nucleic acid-binding Zn ribbon protein
MEDINSLEPRVCPVCGEEFVSLSKVWRYCSPRCRRLGTGNYKKLVSRVCPVCGEEFSPTHHIEKYCSMECRERAVIAWKNENEEKIKEYYKEYGKRRREKDKKFGPRVCPVCKEEFSPAHHLQKYCSKKCRMGMKKIFPKICPVCKEEFSPAHGLQKYCSKKCRERAVIAWKNENEEKIKEYYKEHGKRRREKDKNI